MIKICHTSLDPSLPADRLAHYLERLPTTLRNKIQRYRRPEDMQRVLFGKLLLQNGLEELGGLTFALEQLQYSKKGKPFVAEAPQYNIAYAGKFVLCAFDTRGKIGIDIEKIRPIDLNDYSFFFKSEVFRSIRQATDPEGAFFENWTVREAILKADGCGQNEEAKYIEIKKQKATFKNRDWYFKPLLLDPGYLAYLATDHAIGDVIIEATVF